MSKIAKKNNQKKKLDVNANIKFMNFLWTFGAILEFITIILYFAAMKNRAITYEWFIKLREYAHIEVVYCVFAALNMLVFSTLVMMNRNRERWKDMWLGFICFATQILMLIWFITP